MSEAYNEDNNPDLKTKKERPVLLWAGAAIGGIAIIAVILSFILGV